MSTPPSVVVRQVPLSGDFRVGSPSPDGALFSLADGIGNVAVLDLSTGKLRRVTNDATFSPRASQFAGATAISPNSRFVAYAWYALDGTPELRVVDLEGKHPRVLLRSETVADSVPVQWSHDGRSILIMVRRRLDFALRLVLVSVEDGTMRLVKDLGVVAPQYAGLSPDGEFVIYDGPQLESASARDVFIVQSDGSGDRRLVEHPANDSNPVWAPDGRHALFTSDRSGTMDVWSVPVAAGFAHGEPRLVHRNVGRMSLRGVTDRGAYFYWRTSGTVDVYQASLTDTTVEKVTPVSTSYSGSNISSICSPDGRMLAYVSRRGLTWFDRGSTTLVIRDLQTQQERNLVPAMRSFLLKSRSPDARYVLVQGTGVDGRQGAYRIDAGSGRVSAVLTASARPDWLADGRILYFSRKKRQLLVRNIQTGTEEVVFDCRTEGIDLVADVYGRGFKLSPDGQTLAFTTTSADDEGETRSIAVKVLNGAPAQELVHGSASEMLQVQDWSPDGRTLLFTRWTKAKDPSSLWRVSIYGGKPTPLGLTMTGVRDVSVHPDGTKITFTAGWPTNELWIMENFLTNK